MKGLLILFLLLLVWSFTLASLGSFPLLSGSAPDAAGQSTVTQRELNDLHRVAATDSLHRPVRHR
ncbi:hypothetical protein CHU92_06370 [Flavobacterium cyanobacteriorum]|uniref:Uncharacterized protein n=1 Tax=Flavobacterium cyanobacteriorum TaxID=2022802 RepID=A0A255Z9B8_9FLAO|nr:hypothetical protein [Flavobacterium cyanobacteriorum]OYQ38147.1 hypothetical protein CHU92_06370 [Flavobacterium cyanobacteriorum]